MKFGAYLKEKTAVIFATMFIVLSVYLMGIAFKAHKQYMLAMVVLILVCELVIGAFDYHKRNRFYREFFHTLEMLDQKYLITDMQLIPDFEEGKLLISSLYDINKSTKEHLNQMEMSVNEFKEYIELWIHEIKVPISALSLMNYNGSRDLKKQKSQIDKLSYYVEQILFYARADAPEKDYLLTSCRLENVINKVVMGQKDLLIGNKISIEKKQVNVNVTTDSKWLEFMIGQIVNNCVKYSDQNKKSYIKFYVEDEEQHIKTLVIEDNGIGISQQDIPRVFDKTFTGENGRKGAVSTGMGLYICKKLCEKIGHDIAVESERGQYTRIKIRFGDESFYML